MNKIKNAVKRITIWLLAQADALVTKALTKLAPRGNPTLESIISTFDVAAAELHAFEARHNATIDAHTAEIRRLDDARIKLATESGRAARIKARLAELVR